MPEEGQARWDTGCSPRSAGQLESPLRSADRVRRHIPARPFQIYVCLSGATRTWLAGSTQGGRSTDTCLCPGLGVAGLSGGSGNRRVPDAPTFRVTIQPNSRRGCGAFLGPCGPPCFHSALGTFSLWSTHHCAPFVSRAGGQAAGKWPCGVPRAPTCFEQHLVQVGLRDVCRVDGGLHRCWAPRGTREALASQGTGEQMPGGGAAVGLRVLTVTGTEQGRSVRLRGQRGQGWAGPGRPGIRGH